MIEEDNSKILSDVRNYYDGKVTEHGASSKGVDWNGIDSHYLRFDQLHRLFDTADDCSVLDYGCGYGALYEFLKTKNSNAKYHGCDISDLMLAQGTKAHPELEGRLVNTLSDEAKFDFVVASGLFNVKLETEETAWHGFIESTLNEFNQRSRKGFAFNILTSYSDEDKKCTHLHYADPLFWFDWCKKHCSRNVALLHDYELYEFTILVRK